MVQHKASRLYDHWLLDSGYTQHFSLSTFVMLQRRSFLSALLLALLRFLRRPIVARLGVLANHMWSWHVLALRHLLHGQHLYSRWLQSCHALCDASSEQQVSDLIISSFLSWLGDTFCNHCRFFSECSQKNGNFIVPLTFSKSVVMYWE